MSKSPYNELLAFLARLDSTKITYRLAHYRDDALMVLVSVPGEWWEIEFLADGSIEIEKFRSDGKILDGTELNVLLSKLSN